MAVVALAARLLFVFATTDVPFLTEPAGDAAAYRAWAQRIASGDIVGTESFYQAPLYPYVLGAVFAVLGVNTESIRIVQALWGTVGCVLLAVGTRRVFGPRAGRTAGLMLALYPPAVFYDGIIQKASLDGFLVCVLLFLLSLGQADSEGVVAPKRGMGSPPEAIRWYATIAALLGLTCGLLCLTRENAFVWLPLLAAWILFGPPGGWGRSAEAAQSQSFHGSRTAPLQSPIRRLVPCAAFLLGTAIVLTPVGLRNWVVAGEWSFSTFQAGPNFYIGNHRGATGTYQPLVRGRETPDFERTDATRLAEAASGRALSPREVSRYWLTRALADVRADPWQWIRLQFRKMGLVLNRYEVSDLESPVVYGEHFPPFRVAAKVWHFGVLVPLAAWGLWATLPRWRELWIQYLLTASMIAAVAAFFVLARYRYALVPLLMPPAAVGWLEFCGLVAVWIQRRNLPSIENSREGMGREKQLSHRGRRVSWMGLALAGVAAFAVNRPMLDERRLDAMAFSNLGGVLGANGDLEGATHYLVWALEVHPQSPEIHFNLGYALRLQGQHEAAVQHFRAALQLEPDLPNADFLLAQSLEQLGDRQTALHHYSRALRLDPQFHEARDSLERLQRNQAGP